MIQRRITRHTSERQSRLNIDWNREEEEEVVVLSEGREVEIGEGEVVVVHLAIPEEVVDASRLEEVAEAVVETVQIAVVEVLP